MMGGRWRRSQRLATAIGRPEAAILFDAYNPPLQKFNYANAEGMSEPCLPAMRYERQCILESMRCKECVKLSRAAGSASRAAARPAPTRQAGGRPGARG